MNKTEWKNERGEKVILLIELLEKIVKNQEVPKEILIGTDNWEYNEEERDYISKSKDEMLFRDILEISLGSLYALNKFATIKENEFNFESIEELGEKIGKLYKDFIESLIKGYEEEGEKWHK